MSHSGLMLFQLLHCLFIVVKTRVRKCWVGVQRECHHLVSFSVSTEHAKHFFCFVQRITHLYAEYHDGRNFRFPRLNCERIAASLGWKGTGRSESFTQKQPSKSQSSAAADPAGGTSSSSSMFVLVTSAAEGTGSSSMLVTEQGVGLDAMAVSRGGWTQNI